ncbi:MAG: peptidylprolyl isomerase [Candidatus Vecturithrix sp.]|nr:peptidylprolyl isomerase [Candidatus Vecturithrix sp.]
MKRSMICGFVSVLYIIGMFALTVSAQVVAKVNNEEVLQSDVDFVFDTFVLPQFQAQNPNQEFPAEQKTQVQKNILDQLVLQHLLLQEAAKVGIAVTDEVVNQRYEAFKAQRPDVPEEQVKPFIKNELMIQQMIEQEIVSKITVSDEEMQQYYEEKKAQFKEPEQIQASHILVQVAPDASQEDKDAAKAKIDAILVQLNEGKDFGELAKEHSDCPSKEQGGDLGFFARGMMVKSFEDVAFGLDEGGISDIVETQFGYHIIKLTGKKAERDVPFDEVKDQLKQGLFQQKRNTEITSWIDTMKEQAQIEMIEQQ